MAQPYVGEIRIFAGNFPPVGWMFCEGNTLPISENDVLFQLIGTTYGGDGEETFNLPDLRGRLPMHMGAGPEGITYQIGEMGGVEQVTLTTNQIPNHSHPMLGSADGASVKGGAGGVMGRGPSEIYASEYTPDQPLNAASVTPQGGSQPHDNFQPYLCVNFIISLFGVFPSQT